MTTKDKLTGKDFVEMDVHRPLTQSDIKETCPQAALDKTAGNVPDNIIKLVAPGPPSPVDEQVITELESLLERAKAGRFNGFAYVTITSDSSGNYSAMGTAWAGEGVLQNAHTMIGGIRCLEHRALRELFEWNEDRPLPGDFA